jgi:hypothetical protein
MDKGKNGLKVLRELLPQKRCDTSESAAGAGGGHSMRGIAYCILATSVWTGRAQTNAPLPNASELMQRAIANESKMAAQQERYECRVDDDTVEMDSKGNVKKTETETKEQFYVNGVEVDRTLAKNGKDLSADETKKEDDKVMKKTVKYSDPATAKKETDKQNQQMLEIMQAMQLTDGHREQAEGRSVLFYDIVPNPKFKAKGLNQRFAQVMQGKISIDEATGEPVDVNIKSTQGILAARPRSRRAGRSVAHGSGGGFGRCAGRVVLPSLFPVQGDDRRLPPVLGDREPGGAGKDDEVRVLGDCGSSKVTLGASREPT